MKTRITELTKRALCKWGEDIQFTIAMEEAAEFIQAISKYQRYGDKYALASEYADLTIMMEQIRVILNDDELLEKWLNYKCDKMDKILDSCDYGELPKKDC